MVEHGARTGRTWMSAMTRRDHGEGHRPATPLELLFDLCFVVAVAQAATGLEHTIVEGHAAQGIVGFLMVFAAIWWAWMNFSWFANVFDTDDVPYRLLTFLQIAGALGLAAGVPATYDLDFRVVVISYVVMRIAYVLQWLRARRGADPVLRAVATRMAVLVTVCQIGWVAFAFLPVSRTWIVPLFLVLWAFDISAPILSGWDARMGGHTGHIVERYGLFTIIVLGESITAATLAISTGLSEGDHLSDLLVLSAGGLFIVFAIWWLYFDFQTNSAPGGARWRQFLWGYGHYVVFAAVAAIGAGLALTAEQLGDGGHVPKWELALAVGVPVAAFLVMSAVFDFIAEHNCDLRRVGALVAAAVLVLATAAVVPAIGVSWVIVVIGLILAALVVVDVVVAHRRFAG